MPEYLERPRPDDPRWLSKTIVSALPKGAVVRDFPKSTGNAIAVLQVGDPIHIIDTQPNAAYLAVKVGYKIGWVSRHALRFRETGRLPQLAPDWMPQPVTPLGTVTPLETVKPPEMGTQPLPELPTLVETGEIATQPMSTSPTENGAAHGTALEEITMIADELKAAADHLLRAEEALRRLAKRLKNEEAKV